MKTKWIILVACACLTACSTQTSAVMPTTDPPAQPVSPTEELSEELPTETSQPEETEVTIYEVVSPETITTDDGFVIELAGATIEIHPVMGTQFRLGFRYSGMTKEQIPETKWEFVDPPFIVDLQILRGEDETPIRLDVGGEGGGQHLDEDGALVIGQDQSYYFPDDFEVGQEEHIVLLVTFHEIFGITTPVRYELDLEPLQGPLG
ncbi:MAG: hypothetical protein H0S79_07965 [Anaerolineaceae bacterium]|nr:hypothetical protein [Anaerolineaceae bacterium]